METAIRDAHRATVERLAQGMKDAQGLPVGLVRRPSTQYRPRRAGPRHWVDLSGLDHVLDIPERGDWVDVEGGTTWRQLVAALAPRGLLPAVVPEDADQCVGAALADGAVGAASFRHGPVHATLVEMDVLLPDGRVARCSAEEREDLLHGFPGSCGTLGYVLRARLRTESATPMLAVREEAVASSGGLVSALLRDADDDVLGTEGLSRNRHGGTVRSARCLDGPLRLGERPVELEHWLWRWSRDRNVTGWEWRPSGRLQFDAPDEDVVQDVVVPAAAAAELVDLVLEELRIQPLWLCGLRSGCGAVSPLFPLRAEASYVNVGIWGRVHGAAEGAQANRQLEAWVARLGGFKAPYAQCFLPSDEFDQACDMAAYARLKSKYDPHGRAPHLYDKCVRGG